MNKNSKDESRRQQSIDQAGRTRRPQESERSGEARCGNCRYFRSTAWVWGYCDIHKNEQVMNGHCDKWAPETQINEGR